MKKIALATMTGCPLSAGAFYAPEQGNGDVKIRGSHGRPDAIIPEEESR